MNDKETFKMDYSASQQEEIIKIRKKYVETEENKMETLRALDAKVSNKATVSAMTMGIIGVLLMGIGMSLIMSDFGKLLGDYAMPVGIVIGLLGIVIAACTYTLHKHILEKERKKAAPQIIKLTDELMK